MLMKDILMLNISKVVNIDERYGDVTHINSSYY